MPRSTKFRVEKDVKTNDVAQKFDEVKVNMRDSFKEAIKNKDKENKEPSLEKIDEEIETKKQFMLKALEDHEPAKRKYSIVINDENGELVYVAIFRRKKNDLETAYADIAFTYNDAYAEEHNVFDYTLREFRKRGFKKIISYVSSPSTFWDVRRLHVLAASDSVASMDEELDVETATLKVTVHLKPISAAEIAADEAEDIALDVKDKGKDETK